MIKFQYVVPFSDDIVKPEINFEQMMTGAKEFSEKYKNLVVTEENYSDCKVAASEMNEVREGLASVKTELRKRALAIVEPVTTQIDKVLEVVNSPYNDLKSSLASVKEIFDNKKKNQMVSEAERICSQFAFTSPYHLNHLKRFIDGKCAQRKGSWLTQGVKMKEITESLEAEAARMNEEMDFIERHVKDKAPEVVRFAKVFLVEHAFDSKATLDATDKYEASLAEQAKREEERKQKAMDEAKARLEAKRSAPEEQPDKFRITFEVIGTKNELRMLREFFDGYNIHFKKLSEPQKVQA